jgi:hypothetical protein
MGCPCSGEPSWDREPVVAGTQLLHSSQSGQISSKLKQVMTAEEVKDREEGGEVDVEAVLASEMTERAESENIS